MKIRFTPDYHFETGVEPYVNWEKVAISPRQLCRVILSRGDIDVEDRREIIDLVKLASSTDANERLAEIYPEAVVEYRELDATGKLPSLRISLRNGHGRINSPFGSKKTY